MADHQNLQVGRNGRWDPVNLDALEVVWATEKNQGKTINFQQSTAFLSFQISDFLSYFICHVCRECQQSRGIVAGCRGPATGIDFCEDNAVCSRRKDTKE